MTIVLNFKLVLEPSFVLPFGASNISNIFCLTNANLENLLLDILPVLPSSFSVTSSKVYEVFPSDSLCSLTTTYVSFSLVSDKLNVKFES